MREPDQIWWSAAELAEAGLPDVPNTKRGVNLMAKRDGWDLLKGKMRRRKAVGAGIEYHWTVLPLRARMALSRQAGEPEPSPEKVASSPTDAWAVYAQVKDNAKAEAQRRFKALKSVDALVRAGLTRYYATEEVAKQIDVSSRTIWNWHDLVEGVPAEDWLPYLVPRHQVTRRKPRTAPVDPDFFALIKSDYLRPSQPSLTSCYRRAVRVAKKEGLPVAPIHQVRRLYKNTVSKPVEIRWRKGLDALRRFYPHQTRDKTAMVPLECVQGDYHKFDVFVRWPGEELPVRVQAVFFSDVYSAKVLSWRLDTTANSHTVLLAFGDLVERYGIPQSALLDNGREFAAKVFTGGTPTRFRFKITDEDIPGLLTLLNVDVHWANPYSGQSKPIERTFRDFCDDIAKHPAFEGAYTGNSVENKPENYGNRAIPLEEFRAIIDEEIAEWNARPDRRSEVAFKKSFNDVFNAAYKTAGVRKATEEQRRLWLLRAEGVKAQSKNGEIGLYGARYWSEWMYRIAGQKVVARFDPDDLTQPLQVYDLDGGYLGAAENLAKGGFLSVEDARDHNRKRKAYVRAIKDVARAEKSLEDAEIAARLRAAGRDVEADALPEAEVVRMPVPHKAAPKRPRVVQEEVDAATEERLQAQITRLSDRRATQAPEQTDDPRENYDRARALLEAREAGHPITPEQSAWLNEYVQSSQYDGYHRMFSKLKSTTTDNRS